MQAYKIERWDAVTGNNIMKQPMIYIKPDDAFLTFVRANKFAVLCEISGTGMNYDHQPGSSILIPGVVSRSAIVPNCRPNYYAATEYYVVRLLAPWIGYPNKNLGHVKFYGLEEGMPAQIPDPGKKKKNNKILPKILPKNRHTSSTADNTNDSNNTGKIILIVLGVLALLLILVVGVYHIIKR